MSDVLGLQADQPETPDDEKASSMSWLNCNRSYWSLVACI